MLVELDILGIQFLHSFHHSTHLSNDLVGGREGGNPGGRGTILQMKTTSISAGIERVGRRRGEGEAVYQILIPLKISLEGTSERTRGPHHHLTLIQVDIMIQGRVGMSINQEREGAVTMGMMND